MIATDGLVIAGSWAVSAARRIGEMTNWSAARTSWAASPDRAAGRSLAQQLAAALPLGMEDVATGPCSRDFRSLGARSKCDVFARREVGAKTTRAPEPVERVIPPSLLHRIEDVARPPAVEHWPTRLRPGPSNPTPGTPATGSRFAGRFRPLGRDTPKPDPSDRGAVESERKVGASHALDPRRKAGGTGRTPYSRDTALRCGAR